MSKAKEAYITKILEVLKQEGLHLSMETIAEKIGVTKKTLYNHFSSKEEILNLCTERFRSEMEKICGGMFDENMDAIDALKKSMSDIILYFRTFCPVFLTDLTRLYPEISLPMHNSSVNYFTKSVMANIEKGIQEGIYEKETNIALISEYFTYSIFGFLHNRVVKSNDFTTEEYFSTAIRYHIKGIATIKGMELTDKNGSVAHKH